MNTESLSLSEVCVAMGLVSQTVESFSLRGKQKISASSLSGRMAANDSQFVFFLFRGKSYEIAKSKCLPGHYSVRAVARIWFKVVTSAGIWLSFLRIRSGSIGCWRNGAT